MFLPLRLTWAKGKKWFIKPCACNARGKPPAPSAPRHAGHPHAPGSPEESPAAAQFLFWVFREPGIRPNTPVRPGRVNKQGPNQPCDALLRVQAGQGAPPGRCEGCSWTSDRTLRDPRAHREAPASSIALPVLVEPSGVDSRGRRRPQGHRKKLKGRKCTFWAPS